MSVQLPINTAITITFTGATFEQVLLPRSVLDRDDVWLYVYESTAADGKVWLSTQPGIDGASNTVAAVPDRRPINAPGEFWLGGRSALAIGMTGAGTCTVEAVRAPTQIVRQREAGRTC